MPRRRTCHGGESIEKRLKRPQFEPESTGCKARPARQGKYAEPEQPEQIICEPAVGTQPGTGAESVQLDICQPQPVGPEPKYLEQIVCQKDSEPIQHDYLDAVGSQPEHLEQDVGEPIEHDVGKPQSHPVGPEQKQLEQNLGKPIEPESLQFDFVQPFDLEPERFKQNID